MVISDNEGCQMTKIIQYNLVTSLMSFIQGKTIHGLGKHSALQAVGYSSRGIWGKHEFYRTLEEAK